jgi:hypothetical protein
MKAHTYTYTKTQRVTTKLPPGRYLTLEDTIKVGDWKLWKNDSPAILTKLYIYIGRKVKDSEYGEELLAYYRPAPKKRIKRYRTLKVGELVKPGDQEFTAPEHGWTPIVCPFRGEKVYNTSMPYRRRLHIKTRP